MMNKLNKIYLQKNHYELNPYDTFSTTVDGVYKKFKITNDGDPLNIFLRQAEDTTISYDREYDIMLEPTENVQAEIISIEDDTVIAQLYLQQCEIQKALKPLYIKKLKELGLLYEGSTFNFIFTETEYGQKIEISKINNTKTAAGELLIKQLQKDLGI